MGKLFDFGSRISWIWWNGDAEGNEKNSYTIEILFFFAIIL
jgi:hypothetical protein